MDRVHKRVSGNSPAHRDASDPCVSVRSHSSGQEPEGYRTGARHDTGFGVEEPGAVVGLHKQPDAFAVDEGVGRGQAGQGVHIDSSRADGHAAVKGAGMMVPDAGVEPARFAAVDFESTASTNSANRG